MRPLAVLFLAFSMAACTDDLTSGGSDDAGIGADDLAVAAAADLRGGATSDLAAVGADLSGVPEVDLGGSPPADLSGAMPADLAGVVVADLAAGDGKAASDLALPPDLAVEPLADPNFAGPLKTATFNLSAPIANNTNLAISVYGPSDDGTTLSMKGAPYPTVILSPGFSIDKANYAPYAVRLATHGFLVVSQNYRNSGDHVQNRDDTVKLLVWLLNPTGNDAPRVAGRADPKRVGATGHSLGGKVSFLAAEADARFIATFGIDPVNSNPPLGGNGISAFPGLPNYKGAVGLEGETISSGGLFPCAPAADNYTQFYKNANAPTFAITFTGAAHNDFLDQNGCLVCGTCFGSKAPQQQTLALSVKYVTAFFRLQLLGDVGQQDYLTGARFAADAKTGAVTEVTK